MELRLVRRGDLGGGDRPVHRLRAADVAAAAPGRAVQARAMAPGPMEPAGRHRRGRLGVLHHGAVHAAAGQPGQVGQLQLHPHRGAGGARLRRHLVAGLGAPVVHRAEGAGHT